MNELNVNVNDPFDILENEIELAGTGDSLEFGLLGAIIDVFMK